MKFKAYTLFLFVSFFLFFGINTSYAVSPNSISIDVAPVNPAPYENVTITLGSFAANLDSVKITWLVDGKTSISATGKKSFSLTAKAANVQTRVEAKMAFPDGEVSKKIIIRPSVMVLLWQANDSYVPPFYKGKSLPSADSEIKVVAMPEIAVNGIKVSSKTMTYSWKNNYSNVQNASGYGKNFFTYINDYLENSNTVSVVANTTDQNHESESIISIPTNEPEIHFYKKDATLGTIWEKALSDDYTITGEEIIVAEPYFIAPQDFRRPELLFYWSVGGQRISVPSYRKNLMPLKAESGNTGTSKLKLEIENTDKIFQTAKKEININF